MEYENENSVSNIQYLWSKISHFILLIVIILLMIFIFSLR